MSVKIADKLVIQNLNLELKSGVLDILMGPNGSGKSSLAATIMGHPDYVVVAGQIIFNQQDITNMPPHERARLGIFLVFQNPKAIAGLQVFTFLKTIYESFTGKTVNIPEFEQLLYQKIGLVGLDKSFIYRNVNEGFSGGEQKRFELLQFLLLEPKLAIIDEIDSGLDMDALKVVAQALNLARMQDSNLTILLVTHYNRILNFLQPDILHILNQGKLIKSGDLAIIEQVEKNGYESLI